MAYGVSAIDYIVPCGDEIDIYAQPLEGYHFTRWSDGSTEAARTIKVYGDATYVAYFAPNCGDYAALPLVNRYDWILMLNVKKIITEMHYTISPDRVHWYRVVGNVDSLDDPDSYDPKDTYLGDGYSFTLDKNLQQTGIYYALVDLVEEEGLECHGLSRTELVSFINSQPPVREVRLLPNTTTPNGTMHLVGLNPEIETHIRVYSVTGKLLKEATSMGAEEYLLSAYPMTGVFEVQVLSDEDNLVLRYLVRK